MKEILSQITNITTFKRALVEAGHFYANQSLSGEHKLGIKIGQIAVNTLAEMGLQVTPCILIDDYNSPDLYSQENLAVLEQEGFVPQVIYKEKDLIPKAQGVLRLLEAANKVKPKHGAKYFKEGFKILVSDQGQYSCALLDAALYADKYQTFDGVCVTVLPENWINQTQQQTTKAILKGAGIVIPILNVYFNGVGSISLDFNF